MAQASAPGIGQASVSDKTLTIIVVGALILVAVLLFMPLFSIGKGASGVLGGTGSFISNTGQGIGSTLGGVGSAIGSIGSVPVTAINTGGSVANTLISTAGQFGNTVLPQPVKHLVILLIH